MNMEEGRGCRGEGSSGKFLELFREAVCLFREVSQLGNAAYCLEEMNNLEEAGGKPLLTSHGMTQPANLSRRLGRNRTSRESSITLHAVTFMAEGIQILRCD